ncbi:hypothetical protein, partial [Pseudomonas moraviensis]|uniref:hypothetical protein n=1 Tax=Pseudomonas moraviensis TaxID=321662 RepID=UPI001674EECC
VVVASSESLGVYLLAFGGGGLSYETLKKHLVKSQASKALRYFLLYLLRTAGFLEGDADR